MLHVAENWKILQISVQLSKRFKMMLVLETRFDTAENDLFEVASLMILIKVHC